jgi:hypothetical protein
MDHDQAMRMHAAERYLLDELSSEERADFEEHYFMCTRCAEDVRSAFAFADAAKAVLRDEGRKTASESLFGRLRATGRPRRILNWWIWLRPAVAVPVAAAVLLTVTLYQSIFVIPRLERGLATATQARVIPSVVARDASRGEDPVIDVSERDPFLQLILDINPTMPVSSYTCEVYDAAGTLRFLVPAPAPANGASLNLLLPATGLKAGRYLVRVKPAGPTDRESKPHMDEYNFLLRLK